MENSLSPTPRMTCGIWTTLELIINKESSEMIWDKGENWLKPATRKEKKEKPKLSKFIPLIEDALRVGGGVGGSDIGTSPLHSAMPPGRRLSTFKRKSEPKLQFKHNFNVKAFNPIDDMANEQVQRKTVNLDYFESLIDCSFNLPRASAQLERLMGTNLVRLTDRKYMLELRKRINEDFNDMLEKRIQGREAKELERQRVLLIEGKSTECPKELANHPVFLVNQITNSSITKRRSKLKTKRQRNAEHLLRQGAKWEKERLVYEAAERVREAEIKSKQERAYAMEERYIEETGRRKMELLTIKEQNCADGEDNLKNFLAKEHVLMTTRMKSSEREFDPYTKDVRLVDEKRKQGEEARVTLKSLVGKISDKIVKKPLPKATGDKDNKPVSSNYVDPMLDQLKQTDTVRDMYLLAEEIIDGVPNEHFKTTNKFEDSEEID